MDTEQTHYAARLEVDYPEEWVATKPDGSWTPARIPRCQPPTTGKKWLGNPRTMNDWVNISREHQMWATRLFSETLRRDPKMNSFAIHLLAGSNRLWTATAMPSPPTLPTVTHSLR